MVGRKLLFILLVSSLGALGSLLWAEGNGEPMNAVRLTGVPAVGVQERVLQSAWAAEDLLRITTAAPQAQTASVEIAGIGRREFPPGRIASLRSIATSGAGSTLELFDAENQLIGEVALGQKAGTRILRTFAVTAGAGRNGPVEAQRQSVNVVLTRVDGSPTVTPISVAPGHSVVFNVGGVRWIFTCRDATVATSRNAKAAGGSRPADNATTSSNLLFDYTLFRE